MRAKDQNPQTVKFDQKDTQGSIFVLEFDLDQTHEDDFCEFDEGSQGQKDLLEKIRVNYEGGFAERAARELGWQFTKAVGSLEPFRTLFLIFEGRGSLADHDEKLMAISEEESTYFSAIDLTQGMKQGYDDGDYDTGSLAQPEDRAHYAEYARQVSKRLGLV